MVGRSFDGGKVLRYSALWIGTLAVLLLILIVEFDRAFYLGFYQGARVAGTIAILWLTCVALRRASTYIGGARPWYSDAFLVAVVGFWALFPPSWFFLEYGLFEQGKIFLFNGEVCQPHRHTDTCTSELARLESYASLASKIWAGVGAIFAGAIAMTSKNHERLGAQE